MNFAQFLRTPFSQNTSGRLLLNMAAEYGKWMNTEGSDKMNVEYGTLNTTNTLIKTCMDVI